MKYSVERIAHNLHYNWYIYLGIMFNFMVGVAIFIICMNFKATSAELLKESKQKSTEGLIQVTTSVASIKEEESEGYPITYDTYLELKNDADATGDIEVLFSMEFFEHIAVYDTEEYYTLHIYFMNEELFQYLYGFSRRKGVVYLSEFSYQSLCRVGDAVTGTGKENVAFLESKMYIKGDSLIVDDRKTYPYEILDPLEEGTIMRDALGEEGYRMQEAVIFPVEDVFFPVSSEFPQMKAHGKNSIYFRYLHGNWREDIVARQVQKCNAANRNFIFRVNNEYLDLKRTMEDYNYDIDRWLLVAVSVILLSGVGCVGTTFLLLDKRRHFIAVSIAYGATLGRMRAEMMIEIFIVLLLGGGLGIILSPQLKNLIIYQEELLFNPFGTVMILVIAFLFSVISVLLGMHEIKIKEVVQILKEE